MTALSLGFTGSLASPWCLTGSSSAGCSSATIHWSLPIRDTLRGKIALALREKFRASGATVLYHGHIHDKEPFHGDGITRINVSVDYRACDYRPVKVQGDEAEKEAAKLLDRAMKLRPEKGGLIKEGRLS